MGQIWSPASSSILFAWYFYCVAEVMFTSKGEPHETVRWLMFLPYNYFNITFPSVLTLCSYAVYMLQGSLHGQADNTHEETNYTLKSKVTRILPEVRILYFKARVWVVSISADSDWCCLWISMSECTVTHSNCKHTVTYSTSGEKINHVPHWQCFQI